MLLRYLKDRFLGAPWIYDNLRPLVAGGIDFEALAAFCQSGREDRIFDFGCGTGQLLPFLTYAEYVGVDLDAKALRRAERIPARNALFFRGEDWDEIYCGLNPTVILMIGVVHHLSDHDFGRVLGRLALQRMRPRIVTVDVSYFPGRPLNNFLSRMDRGRHVRTPPGYEQLFRRNGLHVTRAEVLTTRLRYVQYAGYHLQHGVTPLQSGRGASTPPHPRPPCPAAEA